MRKIVAALLVVVGPAFAQAPVTRLERVAPPIFSSLGLKRAACPPIYISKEATAVCASYRGRATTLQTRLDRVVGPALVPTKEWASAGVLRSRRYRGEDGKFYSVFIVGASDGFVVVATRRDGLSEPPR